MFLGRLHDTRSGRWWPCLRCRRYFTLRPDDPFCPDCLEAMTGKLLTQGTDDGDQVP